MKTFRTMITTIGVASLAALAPAQQSDAAATMGRLSESAASELARTTKELDHLREQIAAEKLPLAQELTAAEEKLTQLRKEHDRITRLVDSGNLEMVTIKTETKARQDELDYVANLLDEYARTFESKIDISEQQYCGEAIATARQAGENANLTLSEKFTRQIAFVDTSVKRLFELIGGLRFPGVGVDAQGAVASGQFAIVGPVAIFSAAASGTLPGTAGLVVAQSGSTRPLIRALEGSVQAGLAALVDKGEGLLPLDPSRGGALKALVQKFNLIHVFEKGGPIMWPLLVASILALGTVLERVIFLLNEKRKRNRKALERVLARVEDGDLQGAIRASHDTKDFLARTLGYAIEHRERSIHRALEYAQGRELKRFRRGIAVLDTVITLAPLLGLLGTVTGMMGSFSLIGGDLSAPGAITGGIAEALIATAFGLGIAITSLIPFNILNTKTDEARHELEAASNQLELLMQQPGEKPAASPPIHSRILVGKE